VRVLWFLARAACLFALALRFSDLATKRMYRATDGAAARALPWPPDFPEVVTAALVVVVVGGEYDTGGVVAGGDDWYARVPFGLV